jgi:hypothetical protein
MKGPFMTLPPLSRISRRSFAAGALGLVTAARLAGNVSAQATPAAEATPIPAGESLVLRIESVGGLRPMETQFLQTPAISIYADGTVIQPAIVTAIYPPAAITPLNTFTISSSALAEVVERAKAAKLDEPRTITNSMVMDAGTAQITFAAGGGFAISSIYALQVDGPQPPEWDEETAEIVAGIKAFADWVQGLATSLPSSEIVSREEPYQVEQLQVIAFEPDPNAPLPTGIPDLTFPPLMWPLDVSLEELGAVFDPWPGALLPPMRCANLSGDDVRKVVEVAAQGTLISPWEDHGTTYGILFNPILPGDWGCQTFLP